MPYAKPSDVPSNVPEAYKAQFMEVFNSVHAAALQDKKSPAQADEKSFAQAWSVILKAKAKDQTVEKKNDGGQAADPEQSLRFAADQLREPDGKFASDAGEKAHTQEEHLKAQMIHVGKAREAQQAGNHEEAKAHEHAAILHSKAAFEHKNNMEAVGEPARAASKVANDMSGMHRSQTEQTEERYSEDQPREPNGEFGSGGKIVHEGHDAILKEAGYTQTDKKGQYKDAKGNNVQVSKNGAFTATSKTYQMKVGTTANDLKAAISKRFNDNHDEKGQFASGGGVAKGFVGHNPENEGQHPSAETQNQMGKKEPLTQTHTPTPEKEEEAYQHLIKSGMSEKEASKLTDKEIYSKAAAAGWNGTGGYVGGPGSKSRELSQNSDTREKYMSVEKRYAAELRVGTANEAGGMSLVGYAARFNSPSKDLGGFKEIIAPGAFTRALAANSDVRCLFNHDANKVLGRTLSGTLKLTQDDNGLMFHCTLDPNNTEHRNLHSSVARGDINECSFAFTPNGENGDHWEDKQDADGKYFISRTLKDVNLFDVSAVTNPAYSNTSVQAREAEITPEIRSIMSEIVKKRAAKVGGIEARSESVQEMLNCMSKCLVEQFPRTDQTDTSLPVSWGQYYMCDTYDTYIIACQEGPGGEYVSISFVEKPDGDGFIFGTPVPVEKEWIPSDRCKSVLAEFRAMTSSHMQAIAEQHAKAAAAHTDTAAAHTDAATAHTDAAEAHSKAAADAQQVAERMEKCSATMGDCSTKGCECQNRMIATRDMDDSYEDYLNIFGDDDCDERTAKIVAHRAARKSVAAASDEPMTRCKVVGGSNLPAGAFAHAGDPDETRTWKNAVHDAAHTANSMAADRSAVPADKADAVTAKIQRAAKKFGIQSEAEKAAAVAARAAAEKEDLELRFRLAMAL